VPEEYEGDDPGDELRAGPTSGRVVVKGPNVIRGYWNNLRRRPGFTKSGWLRTGDIAKIDDEGFIYIVDAQRT